MANTFFGLTIAGSGLTASNIAINTTAHNVSNVNTEGYTKQVASQTAADSIRVYSTYGTVGTGVKVEEINQLRSAYYDAKYWDNNCNYGEYKTLESYSSLIEGYLDEFNLDGFTVEYQNLFKALNTLANDDPGSEVARNQFLNYAASLSDYFNTLSTNLSSVQKQANDAVKSNVDSINTIASKIASLNKQINVIEMNGGSANDLRDARAVLIDELSEYVDTRTTEATLDGGMTEYRVIINNQVLVDGYDYNKLELYARATDEKRNASDIEGLYDIKWENGLYFNVYSDTMSGSLKAAIDIRDGCNDSYEVLGLKDADGNFLKMDDDGNLLKYGDAGYDNASVARTQDLTAIQYSTYISAGYSRALTVEADSYRNPSYKGIPYYQSQLNAFAQSIADAFNNIIANADGNHPHYDEKGNEIVHYDGTNNSSSTLHNLFVSAYDDDEDGYVSASSICVNKLILDNTKLLPYSYDLTQGIANNDMVKDLIALKDEKTIRNGTFDEYLRSLVSVISVDTSTAKVFSKNYDNVRATIDNQRTSVSGVDEDEEGVDLVKFQNAYNLSAKVIQVMQEIYSKLINETGV